MASLSNSGLYWTVSARNRNTAVPAGGHGDLQTLICVLVARSRLCPTLSNPVLWQNWMVVYLGYTVRMKTLFRGWPVMGHDTRTRRRSSKVCTITVLFCHWVVKTFICVCCWQPDGAHLMDYGRLLKDGDLRVRKGNEKKERNLYAYISYSFRFKIMCNVIIIL